MSMIEIFASCYSQKENVGIGFGVGFDSADYSIDTIGTELIENGLYESFWENVSEFDASMEKVRDLLKQAGGLSLRQAIVEVFGDFNFCCDFEGNEVEFEFDISNAMYALLEASI